MAQYRNVKEFTDKIREGYSKYREEYIKIGNAILEDKKYWDEELRRGWRTPNEKQEATFKHDVKARELRQLLENVEDRAMAEFEEIKTECVKIFEPYNRATASMIDMPTLELLKSGILKDNELIDLAGNFSDNVTMLRLIGKYAEERANISGTSDRKMQSFANRCKEASFPYIKPIENLIMWSLKAIRGDKGNTNKEKAICLSDGIAKIYEEQAEKLTTEAEKFYIQVSE